MEAELLLMYGGVATHYLYYDDKRNKLLDEGIDGERRTVTLDKFCEDYSEANIKWSLC